MKLYITRGSCNAVSISGLGAVFIWFNEPALFVYEKGDGTDEPFQLDNLIEELTGSLYTERGSIHNFIYRNTNDKESGFGSTLIRNPDGIDFPEILTEYKNAGKLSFKHQVFGDGPKSNYTPIKVGSSFGYDSPLSSHIWELVCKDFGDIPMMEWHKYESELPWWKFCKEIEVEINLIQ